jgi:hypothetical protein
MPNWNLNYMDVKGKNENVKNVLNFIKENYNTERKEGKPEELDYVLDFEKYLPTPTDDKGEIIDNWYEWRLENWGCKWSPLSDQYNHLQVVYENDDVHYYDCKNSGYKEGYEFDEKNIDKLLGEVDKIKEISLDVTFDTPWCPPYAIIGKWSERYKDVELVNKYYEPGCGFVGKMGFNNDEGLFDECYDCSEMEPYLTYLIEEGFESVDWYIDEIYTWIEEMYKEEKGDEFVNALFNKVKEQIENEKDNKNIAKLICEIYDKYLDYCNNNKENK